MNTIYRLIGGILLVAGTTIGAGMLALPVVTGFVGFWPSLALFFVYWLYMTFTAFLMFEKSHKLLDLKYTILSSSEL